MMGGYHPSREEFGQLLEGGEPVAPTAATAWLHLFSCERCQATLASALPARQVHGYEFVLHRAKNSARQLARQMSTARRVVREQFMGQANRRRDRDNAHHAWAWCEQLLETADQLRHANVALAVDLAESAVSEAERLTGVFSAPLVADLQTRALAELANLQRISGNLDKAAESLRQATERFWKGTGDELHIARIYDLLGSLQRERRQFSQALTAFDRAAFLYSKYGERHLVGRVLVSEGLVYIYAEEPLRALETFDRAFAVLDWSRDPGLTLAAIHNALYALVDAGHQAVAARLFPDCRPLYETHGSRLDLVRLLGLEAKVASALGDAVRAERLYRETKAGFAEAGLPYDVAIVSLHLAALLLEQERPAEVVQLVDEMLASFQERGILRETLAALLLLREAVAQGRATAAVVRTLAEQVQRLATAQPGR
jgi:tetratricopeptide (TPR) repeat protein